MVRKFYDAGVEAAGGAPAEENVDFSAFVPVSETPAEADAAEVEITPAAKGEAGEEKPKADEVKPAVTQEGKKPAAEIKADDEKPVITDWTEAIKGKDTKEVLAKLGDTKSLLKALGVSDYVINLHNHLENDGDAKDFLTNAGIDYDTMSDDDIILAGIKSEKPKAPAAVIQKLYQKELEKYETDPDQFDADTVAYGEYLKKEKADEYRAKLNEGKAKYLAPVKDSSKAEAAKAAAEAEQARVDAINAQIVASEVSKKIVADKVLKIGGKDGYNFEIKDPQNLVDIATGKENFFSMFADADGNTDLDLFYAATAFIKNRAAYEKSLIDHGISIANKEQLDDDINPKGRKEVDGNIKEESDWQSLQKNGQAVRW